MSASTEKVVVVSHERSGTHLLMNTIAVNFGYDRPRIDLDGQGIDWRAPGEMERFLARFSGKRISGVFKSHHALEIFAPCMDMLLKGFKVFYIFRDGRDVMTSFWRFLNQLDWDEGPKKDSVGEFLRCRPRGNLCRYQVRSFHNMVDRWCDHVRSWTSRAPATVCRISYEELLDDFEKTVAAKLVPAFGRVPTAEKLIKPSLQAPSVRPWRGRTGTWKAYFAPDDHRFFRLRAGDLMHDLGYDMPPLGEPTLNKYGKMSY